MRYVAEDKLLADENTGRDVTTIQVGRKNIQLLLATENTAGMTTLPIGVIKRLFAGERVTHQSEWFSLNEARLQLLPLQEEMPCAVASMISPSGMTLAGKYGAGELRDALMAAYVPAIEQAGVSAWLTPGQWAGRSGRGDDDESSGQRSGALRRTRAAQPGARR